MIVRQALAPDWFVECLYYHHKLCAESAQEQLYLENNVWYQYLAFCMQAEDKTSKSFMQRIEVSKNIIDILLKGPLNMRQSPLLHSQARILRAQLNFFD